NAQTIDAAGPGLVDDVHLPERLVLDGVTHLSDMPLHLQRRQCALERLGLRELEGDLLYRRMGYVFRRWREDVAAERFGRGLEQKELTRGEQEAQLTRQPRIIDGAGQAGAARGPTGIEVQGQVDAQGLRAQALGRIHADDAIYVQLVHAQNIEHRC